MKKKIILVSSLQGLMLLAVVSLAMQGGNAVVTKPSDGATVCYAHGEELVQRDFELTNASIVVHWFDSVAEVQRETGHYDAEAVSDCISYKEANMAFCEIWTARPTYVVADPAMDALGHEVLHGLTGSFHK